MREFSLQTFILLTDPISGDLSLIMRRGRGATKCDWYLIVSLIIKTTNPGRKIAKTLYSTGHMMRILSSSNSQRMMYKKRLIKIILVFAWWLVGSFWSLKELGLPVINDRVMYVISCLYHIVNVHLTTSNGLIYNTSAFGTWKLYNYMYVISKYTQKSKEITCGIYPRGLMFVPCTKNNVCTDLLYRVVNAWFWVTAHHIRQGCGAACIGG